MLAVEWVESPVPDDLPVRQVYGFIFNSEGEILLLKDLDNYNLPGGKPELGEEYLHTLIRESMEEAQILIGSSQYLGYQRVEGEEEFAQVRFAAMIDRILQGAKDVDTGREYRRLWIEPDRVNQLLGWGQLGAKQVASAKRAAIGMGTERRT